MELPDRLDLDRLFSSPFICTTEQKKLLMEGKIDVVETIMSNMDLSFYDAILFLCAINNILPKFSLPIPKD